LPAVHVATGGTFRVNVDVGFTRAGRSPWRPAPSLSFDLAGGVAGSTHDQLKVTGAVDLGGATLTTKIGVGYTTSYGTAYTLIDNDGVDPIIGTFAGLPEGGTFTSTAGRFRVSYVGGDGNDMTLTAVRPTVVALTFPGLPKLFGEPVTLTASVTHADGGSGTVAGSVEFFDGATSVGVVPVDANGQAVLTRSDFLVGAHLLTAAFTGTGGTGSKRDERRAPSWSSTTTRRRRLASHPWPSTRTRRRPSSIFATRSQTSRTRWAH
jgi:hypothetical protein